MEAGSPSLLIAIALVSFILSFIGAVVGLILGHLRLPLLILYLGHPGAGAMTNLLVSGSGALGGVVRHACGGRISWTALALMGLPSAAGAVIAVFIFVQASPLWSYSVIGVMLVISGIFMIRRKADAVPGKRISLVRRIVVEVILGLGLGALAAITGLMLGSLRLPMMLKYLRMDPKEAVGTNLAVGCLTALAGVSAGLIVGPGRLDWRVMVAVIPPTLLGGYLGGWLTGRVSKQAVQRLAGYIVAFTGIAMLGQSGYGFVRRSPTTLPPIVVEEADYEGWFDIADAELDPEENEMP